MSGGVKFINTATVQIVPSVGIRLTSLQVNQEKSGHGAPVSRAEIRRLLGVSRGSMPLTAESSKHLDFLLDMASRIKTRVESGRATIAKMMQAAKEADGQDMFVKDFTNVIFLGSSRVGDQRSYRYAHVYDGYITKQFCLGFAKDWDPMGKVDPVDFVNALAMEAEGNPKYVKQEEAMKEIFRYAKGIRPAPTAEEDGYPYAGPSRWDW